MKDTKNYLLVLVAFVTFACSENSSDDTTNDDYAPAELKTAIVESNNSFAFDIFNEIVLNEEADANVFISPLSMYYALAMAANGATGETYNQFDDLLGWDGADRIDVLQSMKELDAQIIPTDDKVTVEVANSMWPKVDYEIKESYTNEIVEYFNSEVNNLDLTNPDMLEIINGWIEDKTHGKIEDMLDDIPGNVIMYLINAIYFKGTWLYEFADTSNYEAPFYCADGTTPEVTFMEQNATFDYIISDDFNAIKLPYVDTNYSMSIFIPSGTIADFIDSMNSENWNEWQQMFQFGEATVKLPKFKYEFGTRLINEELIELGLIDAFDPSLADFSGMTENLVWISRVLHKAFVEVNEEGTEAAAATIVEIIEWAAPDDITICANKPFVFTITEETTQNIMFIGKVELPEYGN